MQLDRYDRQILELLQQDGRISNQDLADRIALSPSACLRRLRALEESGLIRGYRALLDARKLGLSLMALIHISMDRHTPERFSHFEAEVEQIPQVLECLLITGQDADYQLKVVVTDMDGYQALHGAGQPGEKAHTYRLAGPTCLAGDIIGDYSFDHPLKPGDLLVFEDMAIYTMVKNNTFNGMPLPGIALLHPNGETELIRTFGYSDFKQRLS